MSYTALADYNRMGVRLECPWIPSELDQCSHDTSDDPIPDGHPSAGPGGQPVEPIARNQPAIGASKRPHFDDSEHVHTLKKARRSHAKGEDTSGSSSRKKEDVWVGCPYYKRSPRSHQRPACKGKGFDEMGKLKDHLKAVHNLPRERLDADLNFKTAKFTSLKTIGRKWERVFSTLFPSIPIPSPYANEEVAQIECPGCLDDGGAVLFAAIGKILLSPSKIQEICGNGVTPLPDQGHWNKIFLAAREETKNHPSPSASITDPNLELRNGDLRFLKVDGLLTPVSSAKSSPRITTDDEGYCDMSPALRNKSLIEPFTPSQQPTRSQAWDNMDAKPIFASETKAQENIPPLSVFEAAVRDMGQALPHLDSREADTRLGYGSPIHHNPIASAVLSHPWYAQPVTYPNPPTTFEAVFDDQPLYLDHPPVSSALLPSEYLLDPYDPFCGSEALQSGSLDFISANDIGLESQHEHGIPVSCPSKCMKVSEDILDWDAWIVDLW
ncbi:hypothetical protein BDW02DRAFT_600792 [Decorospora gaudefroyi]|uniref:Uncharacterized protein n=1 Tax=Decorospora gaudefroyi TaxID=184978 RepID=A0A6A5K919_9PLEO|nr:hypothetical protein BDW02DRAFT_600792 [Decorospora gaudefroyi]